MATRIQITFRDMPPSDDVREVVGQRLGKLAMHGMGSARCHVVVERRPAGRTQPVAFGARLALHDVGGEVASDAADGDALVAVRTAFDRVETQARRARAKQRRAAPTI